MYQPKFPPFGLDLKGLTQYVTEEFQSVARAAYDSTDAVFLTKTNVEPVKPRVGEVRYADGSNWDPSDGAGPYAYVGSTWTPMFDTGGAGGTGAEVCIDSQTASSDTELDFDLPNPTTHDYALVFDGVQPSFAGGILELLFSTDGGSTFLSSSCQNISYGLQTAGGAATVINFYGVTDELQISSTGQDTAATSAAGGRVDISNPGSTTSHKSLDGHATYKDQVNKYTHFTLGGRVLTTSAINAIRVSFSSGNIDAGRFSLMEIARTP